MVAQEVIVPGFRSSGRDRRGPTKIKKLLGFMGIDFIMARTAFPDINAPAWRRAFRHVGTRATRPTALLPTLLALGMAAAPGVARAATFEELLGWCTPSTGSEPLCDTYMETILGGLASPDPVINGGNRTCVPSGTDRAEIVRLVRTYAAENRPAGNIQAIDGVGAALKGRYPCR